MQPSVHHFGYHTRPVERMAYMTQYSGKSMYAIHGSGSVSSPPPITNPINLRCLLGVCLGKDSPHVSDVLLSE